MVPDLLSSEHGDTAVALDFFILPLMMWIAESMRIGLLRWKGWW
jgi:hypothetical protein